MDLKKYDELRKKIDTKDFEGNNKGLDKWLWKFSFIGNISSIFFAYFLVFPALLKAIAVNFVTGNWAVGLAFVITLIFLLIFEIIKRYLIRNFSNDFVVNKKKLSFKIFGWSLTSIAIIAMSFYLSISGSKNLATTSSVKNIVATTEISSQIDSLTSVYDQRKSIYVADNEALRSTTSNLRKTLSETPLNYMTARREYQVSIDKNGDIIKDNDTKIAGIDNDLQLAVAELNQGLQETRSGNADEDTKTKLLFVIIVVFNELIIIGGLYFREFYEYNLYLINQDQFEKIYLKKDRYRALINFIYRDGKLSTGDKVMPRLELQEAVKEKANLQNSNKFVDEFLRDMDRLTIFATVGKRRNIEKTYTEALDIIENYDDSYRVLENLK